MPLWNIQNFLWLKWPLLIPFFIIQTEFSIKYFISVIKFRKEGLKNYFGKFPDCNPVLFWSYNRHGARLPSQKNIQDLEKLQKIKEEIIKNYDSRGSYPESGRLCDKDLEGFRRWNWNQSINSYNANSLSDQGKNDMKYLARRYQTRYPRLLRTAYSDQHYKVNIYLLRLFSY